MLDIPDSVPFTGSKEARNKAKADGAASFNCPYTAYDADRPQNKMTGWET